MTQTRPVNWFALTADTGATGRGHCRQARRSTARWLVQRTRSARAGARVSRSPLSGQRVHRHDSERRAGGSWSATLLRRCATSRHVLPVLDGELTAVAADLQATNLRSATQLRLVMLTGLVIALALVVLVHRCCSAPGSARRTACAQARQQTTDILRTVKDGLFLLDQHLRHRRRLFRRAGVLVSAQGFRGTATSRACSRISCREKTLTTALKFVKILWSERTNENLVKTINPLGEVEVHLDNGNGKTETRYLQFEFHRVRVDGRDHPRAGVRFRRDRARGSGARTASVAKPGAGSGRHLAGHLAHRSGAAHLVPE